MECLYSDKRQYVIYFIITIFSFAADWYSKTVASVLLAGKSIPFFFIKFSLVYNTGIAFSFPLEGTLQIALTLLLLAVFLYYSLTVLSSSAFMPILSGLVLGGGLGNLYERALLGRVTDFIEVTPWFPVFNIADACIFCGIFGLILVSYIRKNT